MEGTSGRPNASRKSWTPVAVPAVFAALLIVGLWQISVFHHRVGTVTLLSVGVTRSDVEDICGQPDAWITERQGLTREPWSDFPASTRPIETAVAAYREGNDRVLYVYYDGETVSCLFYSERGGVRLPRDTIRPPEERSR